MTKKVVIVATAVTCILSINGCNSSKTPENGNDRSVNPSNVVKVLDRVRCHESYNFCYQPQINGVWGACLRNGFTDTAPTQSVKSSRSITELVQETSNVIKTRPKTVEKVDENGIVSIDKEGTEEYTETITIKGYCIGSEYIL